MPKTASVHVCHMQDLAFSSLPPGLANGTMLEVFDLWGSSVLGGSLPAEYSTWNRLSVFR